MFTEFFLPPAKRFNAASLLIPLYLVMLFFFIMLVSIAQPNVTRSTEIMGSINKRFGKTVLLIPELNHSYLVMRDHYFMPLQFLLEDKENPSSAKVWGDRDKLYFSADLNDFFIADSAIFKIEKHHFLSELAHIMQPFFGSAALITHCMVGSKKYESGEPSTQLAIKRAASFALQLTAYGAKEDYIMVGVQSSSPDQLLCNFQLKNLRSGA